MNVEFKYAGQSGVVAGLHSARVAFATNALREAAFFRGELARPLVLRDAMAALFAVVVSDLKFRVRDRVAFRAWLEEQDRKFLRSLSVRTEDVRTQIEQREARLAELDAERAALRKPFNTARRAYFEHAWADQYELEYVLDPVITIHPDELSFEAFSRDESSYARVALKYDLFAKIDAFECGTTNVDFSTRLHRQLDRMRSYRSTRFDVDAGGFTVATGSDDVHREKKIDVPESWVNGFLQVQSVMTLGLRRIRLAPIDVFNLCRMLGRFSAKTSPRALRWLLEPGRPTRVVLEPWERIIELSPGSIDTGTKPGFIRTWGRDRIKLLARVLPVLQHVDVYLAGHGLPSIWVCDLGDVTLTLGLSGWTDQDWSGGASFELLARRLDADAAALTTTYEVLRREQKATVAQLAQLTALGEQRARACVSFLCQSGRAMFDLSSELVRHRDLFFTPFSAQAAIAQADAASEQQDPRAKAARAVFENGDARFTARRPYPGGYKLSGSVRGTDDERTRPLLDVDHEGRIVTATCTCKHFRTHQLTKGPCEHMLALRYAHMARLRAEDDSKGG
ncbi:MAG TPA: SWIM zinc finger family protein [Nannocystaceae bacterium]|nr:SWIM zinc finger family protein [Nannocystaceae bacterium]